MFQIMTQESMEPVAEREESTGEVDIMNKATDIKFHTGN